MILSRNSRPRKRTCISLPIYQIEIADSDFDAIELPGLCSAGDYLQPADADQVTRLPAAPVSGPEDAGLRARERESSR